MSGARVEISNLVVRITVNDEDAVTRCTENKVFEGDEKGWRDYYYNLRTREQVYEHWAFNAVANGTRRVNRLDGWADLDSDAVIIEVDVQWLEYDMEVTDA